MGKLESAFQSRLIKKLERLFPGCLVLKNDENYIQGIPDLTVLYGPFCALLEVKRSEKEADDPEPNQRHYLKKVADLGGVAYFIYPENEREVLGALQHAFESRWKSCAS